MQKAPTAAYLPNLRMRYVDDLPADLSRDRESRAVPYSPVEGPPDPHDFNPDVAFMLALTCGLHQLPQYASASERGVRDVNGIDAVLSYIDADDETIWPTERLKNGVLTFTSGRLAGSVMKMSLEGRLALVIAFGSPVDEGAAGAVREALRAPHAGKHPSMDGAVLGFAAEQWAQCDQARATAAWHHSASTTAVRRHLYF